MSKETLKALEKVNKMLHQPITDNEVVKYAMIKGTLVIKVEPKKDVKTNS